ncbi:hypothetical protein LguiA_022856 [Lonicera macranthoides]
MVTQSYSSAHPLCHNDERAALLQFKHSLSLRKFARVDPFAYPKVASWKLQRNSDCYKWDRVECHQDTGHVIGLELASSCLYCSIDSNSSLFDFVHLQTLNLAYNHFNYYQIPSEIARLSMLSTLNLSSSAFYGHIPSAEISRLSKLVSFDLSGNTDAAYSIRFLKLEKPGLRSLIQNLTNLKELDMSRVDINSQVPENLANLTSLRSLALEDCDLSGEFPIAIFHLPSLEILNVADKENFTGSLPEFHGISPLKVLILSTTNFSGVLPYSIGNLSSLNMLVMFACHFSGYLPASLKNLTILRLLDLDSNQFIGPIPIFESLSQLSQLSLAGNKFDGGDMFWLAGVFLSLKKFSQLQLSNTIFLTNNRTYGTLPSQIKDTSPFWLGALPKLKVLVLQSNKLYGAIKGPQRNEDFPMLQIIDLSNNGFMHELLAFSGPIPKGKQFDTFLNYSYMGNLAICGKPLLMRCGDPGTTQPLTAEEDDDSEFPSGVDWVAICLGLGSALVVGLIGG